MARATQGLLGSEDLQRRLKAAPALAQAALLDSLEDIAKDVIFPQTQREVPVRSGALRDTGTVERTGDDVQIGYGDPNDATGIYASIQHDREDFNHPNGGKAGFVSDPVADAASRVDSEIDRHIDGRDLFGPG